MGGTIKTSFWSRVTFSMRSPLAMSNGCAPVLASYSAITLFTSSMSAVAGSYSRSVVSPWDEKVRILAFMFGLLGDVHYGLLWNSSQRGLGPCNSYCTVSRSCQCRTGIPARILKNQTDVKNTKVVGMRAPGTGIAVQLFFGSPAGCCEL